MHHARPVIVARSISRPSTGSGPTCLRIASPSARHLRGRQARRKRPLSSTSSALPAVFDATTGVPQAIASRSTFDEPSHQDGRVITADCFINGKGIRHRVDQAKRVPDPQALRQFDHVGSQRTRPDEQQSQVAGIAVQSRTLPAKFRSSSAVPASRSRARQAPSRISAASIALAGTGFDHCEVHAVRNDHRFACQLRVQIDNLVAKLGGNEDNPVRECQDRPELEASRKSLPRASPIRIAFVSEIVADANDRTARQEARRSQNKQDGHGCPRKTRRPVSPLRRKSGIFLKTLRKMTLRVCGLARLPQRGGSDGRRNRLTQTPSDFAARRMAS